MTRLTEREKQIAKLVWDDFSNKEIGEKLKIAESTVENHLSNIYEKLEVGSRISLVKKLLEMKVISTCQ